MNNYLLKPFLVLALTAAVTAHAAKIRETETQVFPLGEIQKLDLDNVNGSIECSGWDDSEIEITYTITAKASSEEKAREVLDEVEVRISDLGSTLDIDTHLPKSKKSFFGWFSGNNGSTSVSYEIRVPRGLHLNLHSVNGMIKADDTGGPIKARTVNGKIDANGISGDADMKTVNGSINCNFTDQLVTAGMTFETVNGSIKVYLPETIDCQLRVNTVNGGIHVDLPLSGGFEKKKRSMRAQVNEGGPELVFKTVNGSVDIDKNS